MSRRRKQPGADVQEFVRTDLANTVEVMMINRHKLMVPFPVPAADIYASLWTPAQHQAFEILRGTYVLKMNKEFTLVGCPGPNDKGIKKILITMDEQQPMPPYKELPFACLTEEQQASIKAWMPEWLKYKEQTEKMVAKVRRVGNECTTYGQLIRIWPELQGFLGEYGTAKVHKAKAKSPYPERVLKWDENGIGGVELEDEFKPEAFAPFTHMIAECLMFPVIDDLIHVGQVLY